MLKLTFICRKLHKGCMIPEILRHKVERKFGKAIKYPRDCKILSSVIEKELKEDTKENKISHLTLQRAFGVVPYDGEPSEYTLDILARYAGMGEWRGAIGKSRGLLASHFNNANVIITADVEKGEILNMVYYPDRKLKLQYEGDSIYIVLEVSAGKLLPGDLLSVLRIELNFPFVCEYVVRNGKNLGQYVSSTEGDGVVLLQLEP